jgi:hypothetical protein
VYWLDSRIEQISIYIFALLSSHAYAESWKDIIARVAKRAAFIIAEANGLSGADLTELDLGYFDFDVLDQHKCTILGRMFGMIDNIAHLEKIDVPTSRDDMSRNEVTDLKRPDCCSKVGSEWRAQLASDSQDRAAAWNANCLVAL